MKTNMTINKKSIANWLSMALVGLNLSACSDFLEVQPVGQTTIPVLFSDMDGIRAALPGTYSAMYTYYSAHFYKYPEVAGNMVSLKTITENSEMLEEYNFMSQSDDEGKTAGYIWRNIYEAMANANNILQYQPALVEKYPYCANELKVIKAEALFLRALCHFDLCRVFAQPYNYTSDASHLGIPILTKTPGAEDQIGRNTVREVYAQILQDLKESEEDFGNTPRTDVYHASRLAAQGLLARVYLYMEDWDNAIVYSSTVLDSVKLSYGSNYLDMYNKMIPGTEAIFRLNGTKRSQSLSSFYSQMTPKALCADTLLQLLNDPQDLRTQLIQLENKSKTSFVTSKYTITTGNVDSDKHDDPFILRASEMYLIRAEAYLNKNELTKAASDIKMIIARALSKDVSEIVLPETDKAALTRILEKERAKELCFEGHQFFDITRRKQNLVRSANTNSNVKFLAYPNDRFVLPIPQKELETNVNMVGNPTVNY